MKELFIQLKQIIEKIKIDPVNPIYQKELFQNHEKRGLFMLNFFSWNDKIANLTNVVTMDDKKEKEKEIIGLEEVCDQLLELLNDEQYSFLFSKDI